MKRYFQVLVVILCLLSCSLNKSADLKPTQLVIGERIPAKLSASKPSLYKIRIPPKTLQFQNLFIYVEPTLPDPLQQPFLTLLSDDLFIRNCYNAHYQFAGICRIDANQLKPDRIFSLIIKCSTDCSLSIETYLGELVPLELGQEITITAYGATGLGEVFNIQIPQDAQYHAISLLATVNNIQQNLQGVDQKVEMYVVYGTKQEAGIVPTQEKHDEVGLPIFTGGRALYLSSTQVPPGGWIKAYIKIQKGVSVTFAVSQIYEGNALIHIGRSYFDYIDPQQNKIYDLNISEHAEQLINKTVQLIFDTYSGNPQIKISFDNKFNNLIPFSRKSSAISYSFSPSVLKSEQFKGQIYIWVTSSMASQYYIHTKAIRQDVTVLQPYLTYFDEVQQNEISNYILDERYSFTVDNANTVVNYTFSIQTVQGQGDFYFKRCRSLENTLGLKTSLDDCLIKSTNQIDTLHFLRDSIQPQFITNQHKLTALIDYNITECPEIRRQGDVSFRQCVFQILAVGKSAEPFIFSLSTQRKFHTTYLKQGQIVKDLISRNSYVYYAFSLPSLVDVQNIEIFTTTISGESVIIISKSQQFPTLQSPLNQIETHTTAKSNIVLTGSQLAQEIFISIYAYQMAEVNLGVVVHRKSYIGDAEANSIILQKNNPLTYTINQLYISASFLANSQDSRTIVVSVNELVGHVSLKVLDPLNKPMSCVGKTENPLICQVFTQKNKDYRIDVFGERGKTNKFTISYKSRIQDCTTSALNLPISVKLHPNDIQCFTFPINRLVDLKFVSSLSHLQIFSKQITTDLYAGQSVIAEIDQTHYRIPVTKLTEDCPLGKKKPTFLKTCYVSVEFFSDSASSQQFSFILQQADAQIALFDGIVEKVSDVDMQSGGGTQFYYHLYSVKPIRIFLTVENPQVHYLLLAKIVDKETFLKRNQQEDGANMIREYVDETSNKNTTGNLFYSIVKTVGVSIISIDQQFISRHNTSENYLMLTVDPVSQLHVEKNSTNIDPIFYQIEITQEESYLQLGDTKTGFVDNLQMFTYLIDPEDAIVSLKNLNSQSAFGSNCATLLTLSNGITKQYNTFGEILQLKKSDNYTSVYVRGNSDHCSYQISYVSLKYPVKTVTLSTLYDLNLQNPQIQAFLFYNLHQSSFRIVQLTSAGTVDMYILPFYQNNLTLPEVSLLNYTQFPLIDSLDEGFTISTTSDYFCSQCYYYVVVSTKTKFSGQIVFLRLTDPVPLSSSHIYKEALSNSSPQTFKQDYVFYSLTTYNITFNIISGAISVHLNNPNNEEVISEIINQTKTFTVESVEYNSKQKIQYKSLKAQSRMTITAVPQAQFFIKIDRNPLMQRLFQGYPLLTTIRPDKKGGFEFKNSYELDQPITVMIDYQTESGSSSNLSFHALVKVDNQIKLFLEDIITNIVSSDNMYLLTLKNLRGTYLLAVDTDQPLTATIVVFKDSLTHLTPSVNHLFNNNAIFQLSTNQRNVLVEIFNCKGDLSAIASTDYDDINDPSAANGSLLQLKRPNYGGHYVFGVQNAPASYYMKVDNKNPESELQYIINYYYYDDVNPYESIDALNYDVVYQLGSEGLSVKVNPPTASLSRQNNSLITIKNTSYWVYLSDSKQSLTRFSQCFIDQQKVVQVQNSDSSAIFITNQQISSLLGQNSTAKSFYVNVEAAVQIEIVDLHKQTKSKNYPKTLNILYNTVEVQLLTEVSTDVAYTYWFTNSFWVFVLWMVFPFALAGLFLLYGFKYCLIKLIRAQNQMVQESDGQGTSETLPSDAELKGGAAVAGSDLLAQPDSALQNIKQHV